MNIRSRLSVVWFAVFATTFVAYTPNALSRTPECSFTVKPETVCKISFYKLIAKPEDYNGKYISVSGFLAIDNGRLSVYDSEHSYRFDLDMNSLTIKTSFRNETKIAHKFGKKYVNVTGVFTFDIIANEPGIGYISHIVNIYPLGERVDGPWDHSLRIKIPEEGGGG